MANPTYTVVNVNDSAVEYGISVRKARGEAAAALRLIEEEERAEKEEAARADTQGGAGNDNHYQYSPPPSESQPTNHTLEAVKLMAAVVGMQAGIAVVVVGLLKLAGVIQ